MDTGSRKVLAMSISRLQTSYCLMRMPLISIMLWWCNSLSLKLLSVLQSWNICCENRPDRLRASWEGITVAHQWSLSPPASSFKQLNVLLKGKKISYLKMFGEGLQVHSDIKSLVKSSHNISEHGSDKIKTHSNIFRFFAESNFA